MMPNDGTVYRPRGNMYGLGVPPDGGGGLRGGGMESGQGRGQTRAEWWWQPGPVTSFCWFFSLRTSVYLLALWNMYSGVEYLRVEKDRIPWLIEAIAHDRAKYKEICTGYVVTAQANCDRIIERVAYREKVLDFGQSSIPAYHAIGALFLFFALVGWRAGYTSSPVFAKVFMMAFPVSLSIRVALLAYSPYQTVSVGLLVVMVTYAYFFKVAWSFYARVRVVAEANRIADGMDPPRPVSSTRSDTDDAGVVPLDALNA